MSQALPASVGLLAFLVVWLFGSFGPTLEQYKNCTDWKATGGWAASVSILGMLLYFWWKAIAIPLGL